MIEVIVFAIVFLGLLVTTVYILDRFVFDVQHYKRMAVLDEQKRDHERMLKAAQNRKRIQ